MHMYDDLSHNTAVYLEVANDFSTQSMLNCLFRFIVRRREPDLIVSGNGTHFVGRNNHLQEQIKQCSPKNESMAKRYNEWRFNPPNASHFGGLRKRIIRTARKGNVKCHRNTKQYGGHFDHNCQHSGRHSKPKTSHISFG